MGLAGLVDKLLHQPLWDTVSAKTALLLPLSINQTSSLSIYLSIYDLSIYLSILYLEAGTTFFHVDAARRHPLD